MFEQSNLQGARRPDWILVASLALLSLVGLSIQYTWMVDRGDGHLLRTHILWLVGGSTLGAGALWFFSRENPEAVRRLTVPIRVLAALSLIVLGGTTLWSSPHFNTHRWLSFGRFHVQPSEFARLAIVFLFANELTLDSHKGPRTFRQLALPLFALGVATALTIRQPDLGSAIVTCAVCFSMLSVVRVRPWVLASLAGMVVLVGLVMWLNLHGYQRMRLEAWLHPERHARDSAWQSVHALHTIGMGGFTGLGDTGWKFWGTGGISQTHTDFAMVPLAHKFGFVGTYVLLLALVLVVLRVLRAASRAENEREVVLCVGVAAMWFWPAFLNVGMVLGLIPVVGIPLPLCSYGGSSIVSLLVATGCVMGVSFKSAGMRPVTDTQYRSP